MIRFGIQVREATETREAKRSPALKRAEKFNE